MTRFRWLSRCEMCERNSYVCFSRISWYWCQKYWPVIPQVWQSYRPSRARIVTKRRATSGFARIHPYAMAVEKRTCFLQSHSMPANGKPKEKVNTYSNACLLFMCWNKCKKAVRMMFVSSLLKFCLFSTHAERSQALQCAKFLIFCFRSLVLCSQWTHVDADATV